MTGRLGTLEANLADVRARLDRACAAADRAPAEVELLAVTKTFPASDNVLLAELGLRAFAENRGQDAAVKVEEFTREHPETGVRWSMVGQLQRNKARSVVRWADEVQSVDSVRLAGALERATGNALEAGERTAALDVLVQVCLDERPGRGGCAPGEIPEIAAAVAGTDALRLRGLMAVAPLDAEPEPAFARLATLAEAFRAEHPDATRLSAGMSGDLEAAITHGSTCVRVGTALLGERALISPEE
ncbi:YggS family pyridoxal phosphate-dependent enzyme [Sciscionella marina]|uniref:YggS family pyridoxal phosphate-dependent enzyme n=1 Tax=Sciscionella marina TaxID=508770 RepID=UPI00037A8BEE|nr:YggS family pyridoxal phosphate-dependent enzyme [Sciscionella marina]